MVLNDIVEEMRRMIVADSNSLHEVAPWSHLHLLISSSLELTGDRPIRHGMSLTPHGSQRGYISLTTINMFPRALVHAGMMI